MQSSTLKLLFVLGLFLWGTPAPGNVMTDFRTVSQIDLPIHWEGWEAAGEERRFDRDNLHEFINGGAALYLSYDFQELRVQAYQPKAVGEEEQTRLTVEVYRMASSEDAYGMYSVDSWGDHPAIGQDASYQSGLLQFWKGIFYVRVYCLSGIPDLQTTVLGLGREIAGRIPETGSRPALLSLLPEDGVPPDEVHHFHDQLVLDRLYFLSEGDLLGLSRATQGLLFRWREPAESDTTKPIDEGAALVVEYPSGEQAGAAHARFRKARSGAQHTGPSENQGAVWRDTNHALVGSQHIDRWLVLVFELKSETNCRALLGSLARAVVALGGQQ